MNPVYTGKDVSYIDTKQGQRAIETAVTEAERLGTLAWLAGAPFPHSAALDKAWRILAYGAHHDAITGVESDQVYLDLLGQLARGLGAGPRRPPGRAAAFLARGYGGRGAPPYAGGPGGSSPRTVAVVNGLARPRDGVARVTVQVPEDGTRHLEVRDDAGVPVPSVAEGIRRRPDGSLAEVTLTFLAAGVPALGLRSYRLQATDTGTAGGGKAGDGHRERRVPGRRGSRAGRDGQRHRQAHRRLRAHRAGQRTGHPG